MSLRQTLKAAFWYAFKVTLVVIALCSKLF